MRPVSTVFLDALRGSHKARFEAKIVTGHQTGTNPAGTVIPINGGDVILDGTADIRGSLNLTTSRDQSSPTPVGFPARASDPLTPYGNEIFCRRGIELGDRSTEWVSLGYFRIDDVGQDDAVLGQITVTATDRMAAIVDGDLLQPRQFTETTTVQAVFENLIEEIYPTAVIEFDFTASAVTIGRNNVVEKKRYEFLRDLATSLAKDFYVDHRGVFVIKNRPSPSTPVWTVNAGANGVLVSLGREITREGAFNAVIATGEGADASEPVFGIAKDLDPASPTYWNGSFGKVPKEFSSPLLITAAQCRTAARKLLADNLGVPFRLNFTAVPNPALEPYDPVHVLTTGQPGHSFVHTLQAVTVPLTVEAALTATTREQSSITIGLT